jgi:glucokinase
MKTFEIVLIGDIGGTNSIFEIILENIIDEKNYKLNLELETKKIKNIKNLFDMIKKRIQSFLMKKIKDEDNFNFKFKKIIFVCAGPLNKKREEIKLSNENLLISKNEIKDITKLDLKNILLLNDIEGLYYFIKYKLKKDDYILIKNEKVKNFDFKKNGLIISIGTGLGVLYYDDKFEVPTEISHMKVPKELIEENFKGVYSFFMKRLNKNYLEWEDLISGKNLVLLYEFVFKKFNSNKLSGKIIQKDISLNYGKREKVAIETFNTLYLLTILFLKEINKVFQVNNIIFAGGVIEKNLPSKKILNILKKEEFEEIVILKNHKKSISGLEELI